MTPRTNTPSEGLEALRKPDTQIDDSEKSGGKMCSIGGPQPTRIIWGMLNNDNKKTPEAWVLPLGSLT